MTIAQDLSSALDEVATLRFIYNNVDSPRGTLHFKRLSRYLRSMDRAMKVEKRAHSQAPRGLWR